MVLVTESFTQCVMTMMIFSTFNATDCELFPKTKRGAGGPDDQAAAPVR